MRYAKYWQGAEERATYLAGRAIELGPAVDGYEPNMGQIITDEINADPEEVEQLRQSRASALTDDRIPLVEALRQINEPTGTGWCAPSP